MPSDLPDWKSRAATVIVCKDGKLRAFTDGGVCLGVVRPEVDVVPDPDCNPITMPQAALFIAVLVVSFVVVLWVGFAVIAWWHGASP